MNISQKEIYISLVIRHVVNDFNNTIVLFFFDLNTIKITIGNSNDEKIKNQ